MILLLPDLPAVKQQMLKRMYQAAARESKMRHPLLSSVGEATWHEGSVLRHRTASGDGHSSEKVLLETLMEFDLEEAARQGPARAKEILLKACADIREQQARRMFEVISEATERAGTSLVVSGEELTKAHLLEQLRKIQVDFDEEGGPPALRIVVGDRTMVERIEEWQREADFRTRYEQVIEEKRAEWRDRENRRKLVD